MAHLVRSYLTLKSITTAQHLFAFVLFAFRYAIWTIGNHNMLQIHPFWNSRHSVFDYMA